MQIHVYFSSKLISVKGWSALTLIHNTLQSFLPKMFTKDTHSSPRRVRYGVSFPRWQGAWGQHGAHLGPVGPRWAPCWSHEPCYLGCQFHVWHLCCRCHFGTLWNFMLYWTTSENQLYFMSQNLSCWWNKFWVQIDMFIHCIVILKVVCIYTQRAKFMGPTWGPPGSCRPQMGPMLAPWTLLSGHYGCWTVVMEHPAIYAASLRGTREHYHRSFAIVMIRVLEPYISSWPRCLCRVSLGCDNKAVGFE